MEWIEVTGRTVESAVEIALDTLGVHESELEYEVVAEPKSGFLGIGRSEARIRARVRPISREKPQDKRRRRNDQRKREGQRSPRGGSGRTKPADSDAGGSNKAKSEPTRSKRGPATSVPPSVADSSEADAPRPDPRRRKPKSQQQVDNGARRSEEEGTTMGEAAISVEEQIAEAKRFTEGLLDAAALEATVTTRLEDDHIFVEVEGEGLGTLVGPKGATLSAIEELVRTAVVVKGGGGGARILVDVAGYRRKRREALAGFATKLADEVLATGVAKALEPMSSADRKVVHDTVAEIEGVATISEGEDARRRVVIRPA
jgi:spoIIIJ-associated protein